MATLGFQPEVCLYSRDDGKGYFRKGHPFVALREVNVGNGTWRILKPNNTGHLAFKWDRYCRNQNMFQKTEETLTELLKDFTKLCLDQESTLILLRDRRDEPREYQ